MGATPSVTIPEVARRAVGHRTVGRRPRTATAGGRPQAGLGGPHDLRPAFQQLRRIGIRARVIEEGTGHAATRRPSWASDRGSAMGAVYRHTTAEMKARVVGALGARLVVIRSVIDALR